MRLMVLAMLAGCVQVGPKDLAMKKPCQVFVPGPIPESVRIVIAPDVRPEADTGGKRLLSDYVRVRSEAARCAGGG